jgi:hypothetical protein
MPDHLKLTIALRKLSRQEAVVLMMAEPLPIIRGIDHASRGFALEHGGYTATMAGACASELL